MKKLFYFIPLLILLGCAVNRVDEVKSASDAESLYKVPVIYGIGFAKNSETIKSTNFFAIGFGEYDLDTKKGTSTCLGSADVIWASFGVPLNKIPHDNNLHYHVLMVPPGYYASTTLGITPYEAKPSLYLKIEDNGPQYLGDFWIIEHPSPDPKHPYLSKVTTLPVEYHDEEAKQLLKSFDIRSDQLPHVPLIPTDGTAGFLLCAP